MILNARSKWSLEQALHIVGANRRNVCRRPTHNRSQLIYFTLP